MKTTGKSVGGRQVKEKEVYCGDDSTDFSFHTRLIHAARCCSPADSLLTGNKTFSARHTWIEEEAAGTFKVPPATILFNYRLRARCHRRVHEGLRFFSFRLFTSPSATLKHLLL